MKSVGVAILGLGVVGGGTYKILTEHREFYKATMWAKKFLPTPLIDRGLMRKLIGKAGIVGRRLIQIPPNAYGHTTVAVYELR